MFTCIRTECINDPVDAYHLETHKCFVCGGIFMPTPEMAEGERCPDCSWYECPFCGCCKCDLEQDDQDWIDDVFDTYCNSTRAMSRIRLGDLPDTMNPSVKDGLGMQLAFCKRWAAVRLNHCTDDH